MLNADSCTTVARNRNEQEPFRNLQDLELSQLHHHARNVILFALCILLWLPLVEAFLHAILSLRLCLVLHHTESNTQKSNKQAKTKPSATPQRPAVCTRHRHTHAISTPFFHRFPRLFCHGTRRRPISQLGSTFSSLRVERWFPHTRTHTLQNHITLSKQI